MRTGLVNLPLHPGRAPTWLFNRMVKLVSAISDVVTNEYGAKELLNRLADPYWFQALSCVIGFDWHSSGTTTTTCGALKLALKDSSLHVCGGKGATSRQTPSEIESNPFNLNTDKISEMIHASKLIAKIDNSCVQDGYQLYHHSFIHDNKGNWIVIQQGMNQSYARRYHWDSNNTDYFNDAEKIACDKIGNRVLNTAALESAENRRTAVDLINDGPEHLLKYFKMPSHHEVLACDLNKRDLEVLTNAYNIQPRNYEELISVIGFGPKKVRALALISDLVFGAKASWRDPVKYSYTHGGKDGHPYPVDKESYDNSIQFLKTAVEQSKLDDHERINAIKRLKEFL